MIVVFDSGNSSRAMDLTKMEGAFDIMFLEMFVKDVENSIPLRFWDLFDRFVLFHFVKPFCSDPQFKVDRHLLRSSPCCRSSCYLQAEYECCDLILLTHHGNQRVGVFVGVRHLVKKSNQPTLPTLEPTVE